MNPVSPQRIAVFATTPMKANRTNSQQGVALVLVLVFLVLITGLIVAYFTSVTTELKSSKSYADEGSVRQLADSAVSAVIGQIREATSQSSTAWASQPGMIRLFDNTGKPSAYYKLYSSDNLIVTADQIQAGYTLANDLAADWDKYPRALHGSQPPRAGDRCRRPDKYAQARIFPLSTRGRRTPGSRDSATPRESMAWWMSAETRAGFRCPCAGSISCAMEN